MGSVKYLTDRVAIVTASTKGIGFAIARRLGMDGASVVVSSRKQKNVDDAVNALKLEGIDCSGVTAHVGIDAERKKLVQYALERYDLYVMMNCVIILIIFRYGKLDILISNAAVNPHKGDLMSVTDSQWDKLLNVNVKSAFLMTQEAVPHLEKSGNGNIVFVSSVAGYSPIDGIGAYSIMKTALLGINKALSQNLARKNIRVNAIAPGIIRTDFSKMLTDGPEKIDCESIVPLGRFGEADECAGAVSFLVCLQQKSFFMTNN